VTEPLAIDQQKYDSYVTWDKNGNLCLLVICLSAIYDMMMASILYYWQFKASLESIGFEFHPYDPCVVNKMVEGKQWTICFNVDDCKISHAYSRVVDQMIEWLRKHYETVWEDGTGKMNVSQGKIHKYLERYWTTVSMAK